MRLRTPLPQGVPHLRAELSGAAKEPGQEPALSQSEAALARVCRPTQRPGPEHTPFPHCSHRPASLPQPSCPGAQGPQELTDRRTSAFTTFWAQTGTRRRLRPGQRCTSLIETAHMGSVQEKHSCLLLPPTHCLLSSWSILATEHTFQPSINRRQYPQGALTRGCYCYPF